MKNLYSTPSRYLPRDRSLRWPMWC